MSNPNDSPYPLAMRIVVGFLFAALVTYIPIAAFAVIFMDVEYLWGGGTHPPPPGNEYAGVGAALVLFIAGPICALVAGVVGAYLAGYRKIDLRRMVFGVLVAATLAIAAILVAVFGRVLEFL